MVCIFIIMHLKKEERLRGRCDQCGSPSKCKYKYSFKKGERLRDVGRGDQGGSPSKCHLSSALQGDPTRPHSEQPFKLANFEN